MSFDAVPHFKGLATVVLRDKVTEEITFQETYENAITTLTMWRFLLGEGFQNDTYNRSYDYNVPVYEGNSGAGLNAIGISGRRYVDHPSTAGIGRYSYGQGSNLQDLTWFAASGGLPDYVEIISRFSAPSSTRDIWTIYLTGTQFNSSEEWAFTCASLPEPCTQTDTEVLDIYYRIQMFYESPNVQNSSPVNPNFPYFTARTFIKSYSRWSQNPYFPHELEPQWVKEPSLDVNFENIGGSNDRSISHGAVLHTDGSYDQPNVDPHRFKVEIPISLGESKAVGYNINAITFGHEGDWYDYWKDDPNNNSNPDEKLVRSIMQRFVPETFPHKPVQPVHNHNKDAISPYLDVDYLASGSGSLTPNGNNWTDPDFPKLHRLNIVKSGDVGVSTYYVQQRNHVGLNYYYNSHKEPIPHKFGTPDMEYHAASHGIGDFNHMEEYDPTNLVSWDKTGINVHSILRADYVVFDADTSPALPVTNVSQVGVDDSGNIYVACRDTGLYKVTDPYGSPSVVHFNASTHGIPSSGGNQCFAVAVGYNNSIIAIFNGALSISTDSGSSWTNYTPSTTPAFDYPDITNSNWSAVNYLRVDRQSPTNQLGILYDNYYEGNNGQYFHQRTCWWSTNGTAYAGPRRNNQDPSNNRLTLNRYRHFKCSRYGSMWMCVEYNIYNNEGENNQTWRMYWGEQQMTSLGNDINNVEYETNVNTPSYIGGVVFFYDDYMNVYTTRAYYNGDVNYVELIDKNHQILGRLSNAGTNDGSNGSNDHIPIFSFEKGGGHPHYLCAPDDSISDNVSVEAEYLTGIPVHIRMINPYDFNDSLAGGGTVFQHFVWETYGWDGSAWVKEYNIPVTDTVNSYDGDRYGFVPGSYDFDNFSRIKVPSSALTNNFTNQGSLSFQVTRKAAPSDVPETPHTIFSVVHANGAEEGLFIEHYNGNLGFQVTDSSGAVFSYGVSQTALTVGQQYTVTFAFYGSNFDVFIDGAHEQNVTMPYYIDWSDVDQFYLGLNVTFVDAGMEDNVDDSVSNVFFRGRMSTVDLWNTVWSDIDEGTTNYSVTTLEDFETGSLSSEWTVWNEDSTEFEIRTDYVFEGTYSGGVYGPYAYNYNPPHIATFYPSELSGGVQPDGFMFKFLETRDQNGVGFRLYDSSGNEVVGVASNNPGWRAYDASGITQIGSGQVYETWMNFTFYFDWTNGTYTLHASNMIDKIFATHTGALINNTNIESFFIDGYDNGTFSDSNAEASVFWVDLIQTFNVEKATNTADSNKSDQTSSLSSTNHIVSYNMTDPATDLVGVETKPTHTTSESLVDGITVSFSDGDTSPSFVNTDYYTYGLTDGILKDNAISFDYKTAFYMNPTDINFADFFDNQGNSTVPSSSQTAIEKVVWRFGGSTRSIQHYIPGAVMSGYRDQGDDNWATYYAGSYQALSGDGYFEFTVHSDIEKAVMAISTERGISNDINTLLYNNFMRFYRDGTVHVTSAGTDHGQQETYGYGDTFRIEQSGGDLLFRKYDSGTSSFVTFYTESGGAFSSLAYLKFIAGSNADGFYNIVVNHTMDPYFMHIGDPSNNTGKFDTKYITTDSADPKTYHIDIGGTPATIIIDNTDPYASIMQAPNQGEIVINGDTGTMRFNSIDAGKTVTGRCAVIYSQ